MATIKCLFSYSCGGERIIWDGWHDSDRLYATLLKPHIGIPTILQLADVKKLRLTALTLLVLLGAGRYTDAQETANGKRKPEAADPRRGEADKNPAGRSREAVYVLVGAGDVAGCDTLAGAEATAKLIERIPGTVFVTGDLAYDRGTSTEFKCYDQTWGRFKDRTRPAPGNHEYVTGGGWPYFAYWGERAGPRGKGYYSYDLGHWHIVALNTNCSAAGVGGCGAGSEQEKWLKEDLATHAKSCIVAYGHHALFSSGVFRQHAVHPELRDLWKDLYAAHADLVLAGHEHSYERFAPQTADGELDEKNGVREIVVGTGGRSHYPLGLTRPNSEERNADTFGVLKLTLYPNKYGWEFVPVSGEEGFHDAGEMGCHNGSGE